MVVRVDTNKCSGIGMCEMTAPTVFEVNDEGQASIVNPEPTGGDLAAAQGAISSCPTGALSID